MQNSNTQLIRLTFVDSLRGLAALFVLGFHMVYVPHDRLLVPNWLKPFVESGGSGVTLFFIISAFTLCFTLQFQKRESNYRFNFYIRRIFRIVPLYYAWLIFMVVFQAGTGLQLHFRNKTEILLSTVFGYNFVPGKQWGIVWASWTLGVEMIFYLVFPFIFSLVNSLGKSVFFLSGSFLIAFIHYKLIEHLFNIKILLPEQYDIHISIFNQLPVFAMGIMGYYLYFFLAEKITHKKSIGTFLFAAGVLLYFLLYYFLVKIIPEQADLTIVSVAYLLVFLGLALFPVPVIVNKVTRFYGLISYSLYLNHPIIVYRLNNLYKYYYGFHYNLTLTLLMCYLSSLALITFISYFTFKFIESPGIAYGRQLIKRLPNNFSWRLKQNG